MSDVCTCNKEREIDSIQRDIRGIEKTLNGPQGLVAKINNGISTEVPLLRKAYEKLNTKLGEIKLTLATNTLAHPSSNNRPKIPRLVGTVLIASSCGLGAGAVIILGFWIMLKTGLIDMEAIGQMVGAIWEKI